MTSPSLLSSPPWVTARDLDLRYLLGEFDAKRMIRLEGLFCERKLRSTISRLQTRYPLFDRNLTYYTIGVPVNGSAPFNPALAAGFRYPNIMFWSLNRVFDVWSHPGVTLFNPAMFATRSRLRKNQEEFGFKDDLLQGAPTHEFGHQIHAELVLSDVYLGTDYHRQLSDVVRLLCPAFDLARGIMDQDIAVLQGYGLHKPESYAEVIAELFRLSQSPRDVRKRPEVMQCAVERFREIIERAWAPEIRDRRQHELLSTDLSLGNERDGRMTNEWLCFDLVRNDAQFIATLADEVRGSKDPRFVAMALHTERLSHVAVGVDRVLRLAVAKRQPGETVMLAPFEPVFESSAVTVLAKNVGVDLLLS